MENSITPESTSYLSLLLEYNEAASFLALTGYPFSKWSFVIARLNEIPCLSVGNGLLRDLMYVADHASVEIDRIAPSTMIPTAYPSNS